MIELDIKKLTVAQANACFSINELAEKSGISRRSLSSLIHKESKATVKTIGLLAKALNVDVTEIIAE